MSAQKIGSWNGVTLIDRAGPSFSGRHEHTSHMLRLQTRCVIANEWRSGLESGTTIMEPGSFALLPARSRHGNCSDKYGGSAEEPEHMIALFTNLLAEQAADATYARGGGILLREDRHFRDVQLERLLWILHDEALRGDSQSPLFGDTIASAISMHLATNYAALQRTPAPRRGGIPPRQLKRVLDYIEAHLTGGLRLAALAAAADMSPFHFSRAFRQSMSYSPHQYVLARRIERAKALLRGDELTIGEIGARSGFARQNHFARVFQKTTGLTPTEFRCRRALSSVAGSV